MLPVQVVIVSGRSGSGKTSVLNILEDFGYYPIDNLPLSLMPDVVDTLVNDSHIGKIALGVDVRSPQADLSNFGDVYDSLVAKFGDSAIKILYVTAQDSILIGRFEATRRVHPLMLTGKQIPTVGNLPNAINKEIQLLEPIATRADIKIDTSLLNTHELKERIREHLGVDNVITINILSFGFKYGAPIDADFVFDVRILPNPHWKPELRRHTGLDDEVKAFFAEHSKVDDMGEDVYQFFDKWLPQFLHNNRHTVTIGIGCTGGKHRSVYMAEQLGEKLSKTLPESLVVRVKHREKSRW